MGTGSWPLSLTVRTSGFHPDSRSSTLLGATIYNKDNMRTQNIIIGKRTYCLEVANTIADRAIGLSGRTEIASDGMLFEYKADHTGSYTMSNTNFDLDIAFFDKDQKLIAVFEAKANDPKAVKPGGQYRYVIELPCDPRQWEGADRFTYEW